MYNNNQFGIEIIQNINEAAHMHPDMEIIYSIEGETAVHLKDKVYSMKKNDIIVINSSMQHSLNSSKNSIVCCIKYNYQVLIHMVKKPNILFWCNSCADNSQSYKGIRALCQELICQEIVESHKTESYKYSLLYQILDILVENYLAENNYSDASDSYDVDEKLQQIIRYVHEHYQDGISLSELAKKMYTSTSTLSRLFKKQTGIYFAEYVNEVRIHYAVNELLFTEKNITKIAMDCGFSNSSAFNKSFREFYSMAPTEYRLEMKPRLVEKQQKKQETKRELQKTLQFHNTPDTKNKDTKNENTIEIAITEGTALKRIWNKVVNIGSMQNLTMANVQFQLQYLVKELGFTHARIWSVFTNAMMICDGKSIGIYNYDTVDGVLDFLVRNHIYPWFDFTRRPDANMRAVDDMLWMADNTIEFTSRRAWEALFDDFLKHIVNRYGIDEVKNWYFEIGREPFHKDNYYYKDPEYCFANVYQFAYKKLREIVPGALIGISEGPSNACTELKARIFQEAVADTYIPDFVAFILFPYIPHFGEERTTKKAFLRSTDKDFVMHQVETMQDIVKQAGLESCKLFISEWNITASTRNFLNDSCFRGSFICQKTVEIGNSVDVMGIWIGSDWICNYYDSHGIVNGGGGLLTKDGIRKPAYFAFQFLNRLGDRIIAKGENYILTRKTTDDYVLLCFNVHWYSPNYFMQTENLQHPEILPDSFESHTPTIFNIVLSGVNENCTYIIKKRCINGEHGSILDEWKRFNFDTKLERTDVKYLQEICIPHLGMERVTAVKDKLKFSISMESHEFIAYHIFPAE